MKRMIQLTLLMASIFLGSTAMAVQHDVMILKEGYFPNKLFFVNGDTIRFTNATNETIRIGVPNVGWIKTNLVGNGFFVYSIPNTSSLKVNGPSFPYRYSNKQGNFQLEVERATAPTSCPSSYLESGVCN
jgi:hypothetical protein